MIPSFVYRPLSGHPSEPFPTSLVEGEEEDYARRKHKICRWHWMVHAGSAVAVISLLVLLMLSLHDMPRTAARCWDMYNYYSPVNDALARRPYVTTRFNGSLWYSSPFKGPPTPAVEDAWHAVMQYGMIAVTAEDYERTGHSIRTAVRFPPEAGGGYVATTVGTHQLHCLHYLWQDHHRAHFPDTLRKAHDVPELYERHFEHCVDYIRQSLMCHFDTGLVTYDWVRQHQNPSPNANAMHKCVDWDAAQQWLRERAVKIPEGFVWKQPEGQESLPWNP
ncbi:Cyclochlorotine biosynthesis protein O [Madurella fahalii]|uniref:Cyclochlorotine biosynthesis protein O n=1 Tax=Madurella fahalii TaxID=1157608 RepID=A0ABQ0GGL1_9PEZI